jgi:hypothetical protein
MKKILLLIITLLVFPTIVNANTVTCTGGGITCNFDTNSQRGDCKDSSNKSYSTINYFTAYPGNEILQTATNNYQASQAIAQGRCPKYMYVDSGAKEVFFLDADSYTFKYKFNDVEGYTEYTWSSDDFIDALNIYGNKNVTKQTLTTTGTTTENTCANDIMIARTQLYDASSAVSNSGCNQQTTGNYDDCKSLMTKWNNALTKGNETYNKYKGDSSCTQELADLNAMLENEWTDYNMIKDQFYGNSLDCINDDCEEPESQVDKNICPLGPEVIKDIKGALRIFQILGPLITVVFTIWEIIKGLTKGEIEKEFKTIWQRTYKRVIAAFILFFIPVLLNLAFQIFGLFGDESCSLDTGERIVYMK